MWIQGVKQMRSGILTDSSRHSLSLYGKEAMYGNGDSGCHSADTSFYAPQDKYGFATT